MTEIGVGLQLYTLRNECEKDFFETLISVEAIGYEGVELAGLHGHEPSEVKNKLDELGLSVIGHHITIERIENDLETVIEEQKVLGNSRIICPWLPPERRSHEDFLKVAKIMKNAAEVCTEHQMELGYHHHDFELGRSIEGSELFGILEAHSSIQAEFDIYWLNQVGHDPVEWMQKFSGRTPIIHLKDRSDDEREATAILGTGNIAIQEVVEQGQVCGVKWWVVEQDDCDVDPIESVTQSYKYLREIQLKK
ncbi:sugar phosphate isomerase/epimerase family protein [Guptibacillus hwajinpoensis]|uniref:sugar phosphate isomerase/epimerase family protein n=1 Tax=Guptibacillus hwajinpoensis TaxID=208199 RepID=UPI001CFF19E7|nr:sugar phosphate isomerase/epimerase [Pseudalkalibacillus hwajinpoensis]WLR61067.1 sugar phosphate isomerase/epimerase [Pseudalkalibacillus hwajinpoensis]